MEADWDLNAVVRGSSSSSVPSFCFHRHDQAQPSCVAPSVWSQFQMDEESLLLDCQPQFEWTKRSSFEELHDLYKPFFRKPQPVCWKNAPLSSSSSSSSLASSLFERTKSHPSSFGKLQRPSPGFRPGSQTSKSKKRKNTLKKVCEVPADSVSSDVWAWRKYGQKPIKGSPFPRSYYRCSSSKGCLARKQVERHRSDPGMFIITYTAEHNHSVPTHRNSLAGVTRQKQTSPTSTPLSEITNSDSNVQATSCSCSSPNASHDSPDDEKDDSMQEVECEGLINDTFPSDDFFVGLEGFMGGGDGDGGSGDKAEDRWDPRQTCFRFPWTANNTAASAGGS